VRAHARDANRVGTEVLVRFNFSSLLLPVVSRENRVGMCGERAHTAGATEHTDQRFASASAVRLPVAAGDGCPSRAGIGRLHTRRWFALTLTYALLVGACGASQNSRLTEGRSKWQPLDAETPEPAVRGALRYVMTEIRRLSSEYRYAALVRCHSAEWEPASFNGRNLFLDVELDMLRGQLTRHRVMVFLDDDGAITGMSIDEFPHVKFREESLPDV